jgi:hypothetical protein
MTVASGDIARVLQGARKRQLRVVALASAGFGLAAALVVLLAGAAALGLGARPSVRSAALAAALTALLAAAALGIRALVRRAWSAEAVARAVSGPLEADQPGLSSDLVSSIQLGREREEIRTSGRYSLALVDGHLERTAARARALDLDRAIPDRWARFAGLALLGVVVLHGVALLAAGGTLGRGYERLLEGEPGGAPAAVVDPITGDIELTFAYPAYMKREPRTLSGTGGEVRVPKGTEVSLVTRADRPVAAAELVVQYDAGVAGEGFEKSRAKPKDEPGTPPGPPAPVVKHHALTVTGDRGLSGRFLVAEAGAYRFRFLDGRGKVLAEGPPIPIVLEEDAFPQVRIVRPERELEVDPGARVRVDFAAEDDFGLGEITLVTKPPAGAERRRVLRKPAGIRRDSGGVDLDLGPERLGEGEKLLYWIEAADGDTVSGPKVSASETHTLSVYSEAEHRRQALEKAKQVLEETIGLLADRLETFAAGSVATAERLPLAQALDQRTRQLHERMRETAREIRRDRAGPKEVAAALRNVASAVRLAEARLVNARASVAQAIRVRVKPEGGLVRTMGLFDGQLDAELEKGILYLEQLLDKQRARDLVRLAKDLAERRRELADVMAEYRQAPTDEKKQALLAQIGRMKERVRDLLKRMSELSRGFNDEHMNAEALAEMARSKDLLAGLDDVEKKLAAGDVEGAMKALDQMASQMDQMLAGLSRTAELPDEKQQALMKEMLAFKEAIEDVQAEQQRTAGETEKIRGEYRKQIADRLKKAEDELHRLAELAGEARRDVEAAQPGVGYRAEVEYEQAHESLADLERALGMKELGAAAETAQRAAPSVERLAAYLEEDAALAHPDPFAGPRDQRRAREAEQHVRDAVPKAREIRDALAKLFPDPREVLGQDAQKKLGELSKRQGELERRAGDLQRQLGELMEKAPVFPPQAQGQLGETRGHMGQAAAELGNRNPQRGHGQQELAMDALSRFKKGLEEASKQQGGGAGGMGFPFPFAESGGEEGAEGRDFSREKVAIPGAEAYQVPEEFRKDLLEAMKQGAPERYRGEVQRYYEELVK